MAKLPRGEIQKPENRNRVVKRLWQYIYKYKWMFLLAFILTLVSNVLALIGPILSGKAIDAIGTKAGTVDFKTVIFYCAWMMALYIISSLLTYILSRLMIRLSKKIVYQMRKDVFHNLAELPVNFFDTHQAGDIISRLSYDIDTINASLSSDLLQICTSIITVVGSLAMMIAISPVLVLVFVVTIPLSVYLTKYMSGKIRPMFKKRSVKLGELNGFVEEIVSGQKTVKAYCQEGTMIDRFDEKNEEAVEAYYRADYHSSAVGPGVNFVNNLSLLLISVFGAILYIFGSITLGNFSSFVLYSRKFSGPINEMANILSELQSALAAAERVFKLIDEPTEPADAPSAHELTDVQGEVEMKNVTFGYVPNKNVIKNLNLQVPKGNTIAIVGQTGAGKTTLVNLLMRFYDIDSGQIMVDNHNIKHVTRNSLRLSYSMVLQDTWLFHGTIFENIAYGNPDATLDDVIKASQDAKIHGYISSLPKGYDTLLTDNAINISQGQRQLITIARAMLLDSKMLILDEATSNVDTQTEEKIQQAMKRLMKDKTCFIIAHRLSTVRHADTILVVQGGEIVEQGRHDELLLLNGIYSQMYHSQFQ